MRRVQQPLHAGRGPRWTTCAISRRSPRARSCSSCRPTRRCRSRSRALRVFPATGCNSSSECPPRRDLLGDDRQETGKIGDYAGPGHRPAGDGDRAVRPAGAVLLPARRRDLRGGLRHLARRLRPRPGRLPVQGAAEASTAAPVWTADKVVLTPVHRRAARGAARRGPGFRGPVRWRGRLLLPATRSLSLPLPDRQEPEMKTRYLLTVFLSATGAGVRRRWLLARRVEHRSQRRGAPPQRPPRRLHRRADQGLPGGRASTHCPNGQEPVIDYSSDCCPHFTCQPLCSSAQQTVLSDDAGAGLSRPAPSCGSAPRSRTAVPPTAASPTGRPAIRRGTTRSRARWRCRTAARTWSRSSSARPPTAARSISARACRRSTDPAAATARRRRTEPATAAARRPTARRAKRSSARARTSAAVRAPASPRAASARPTRTAPRTSAATCRAAGCRPRPRRRRRPTCDATKCGPAARAAELRLRRRHAPPVRPDAAC